MSRAALGRPKRAAAPLGDWLPHSADEGSS
jgi:hypothetical protein